MEIETRFKVGDTVWYMSMNRVSSGRVCAVRCKVGEDEEPAVEYILGHVGDGTTKPDMDLYESKGKLIEHLRHEAGE